jgi:hypothetical protein
LLLQAFQLCAGRCRTPSAAIGPSKSCLHPESFSSGAKSHQQHWHPPAPRFSHNSRARSVARLVEGARVGILVPSHRGRRRKFLAAATDCELCSRRDWSRLHAGSARSPSLAQLPLGALVLGIIAILSSEDDRGDCLSPGLTAEAFRCQKHLPCARCRRGR